MLEKAKIILILVSATVIFYCLVGGLLKDLSAEDDTYAQLEMFTTVLSRLKAE